jgi:anti-anti-sigma factor
MIKIRKEKEEFIVSLYEVRKLNTLFADRVGEQLRELVEKKGVKVFFDLSRISFIDSAGFSMLKETNRIALVNSSEFYLCNPSPEVNELMLLPDFRGNFKTCKKEISREKVLVNVG